MKLKTKSKVEKRKSNAKVSTQENGRDMYFNMNLKEKVFSLVSSQNLKAL